MGSFEKLVTMKFSRNLINIFAFSVIVDNSSPLVNFVLFSISKSFEDECGKSLKGNIRLNALTSIEGGFQIGEFLCTAFINILNLF